MELSKLSVPEAAAITALAVLTALISLISTVERGFVAKRQQDNSACASVRSLIWQHPRAFYYLWIVRGGLSIVACLLPLAPMWIELVHQPKHKGHGLAASPTLWATSALVACIASCIADERLLYLSFTDSFTPLQAICTIASVTSIVLLIIGEPFAHSRFPLAWTVSGCALHRLFMIVWWYSVTHRNITSSHFRNRARLVLAGHGIAFACVFLTFLPVLRDEVNHLLWLTSLFLVVELITTAQAARRTRSNWMAERLRRRRPTPYKEWCDGPRSGSIRMPPASGPSLSLGEGDELPLADLIPVRRRDGGSWYDNGDEVPLATMLKMSQGTLSRDSMMGSPMRA